MRIVEKTFTVVELDARERQLLREGITSVETVELGKKLMNLEVEGEFYVDLGDGEDYWVREADGDLVFANGREDQLERVVANAKRATD